MPSKLLKHEAGGVGWAFMDVVVNALTAFFVIFMIYLMIPKEDLVEELIRRGRSNIEQALKQNVTDSSAYDVKFDGHRQTITLGSNVLFAIFDYRLQDSGRQILAEIERVLEIYQGRLYDPTAQAGYFSTISIDGHTDSLTVLRRDGCITSNWHLSSLRAISVLEFFENLGIDAKRMSATGYASTRPESTHPDSLYLNRRVEITLIYSPEEIRAAVKKSLE